MRQAEVISRRLVRHQSYAQISRDLKMGIHTIRRIMSREDVVALMREGQSGLLRLVPKSLAVYEDALDEKKVRDSQLRAAMDVVHGCQIAVPKSVMEQAERADSMEQRSDEELEFILRFGRWPTREELDYREEHGTWNTAGLVELGLKLLPIRTEV